MLTSKMLELNTWIDDAALFADLFNKDGLFKMDLSNPLKMNLTVSSISTISKKDAS
jgi:hypothetical protein